MSPDVWLARNQHWQAMTLEERDAFVCGLMRAYCDVFQAINDGFKRGGSLNYVFESVRELFDVERDRATVAGVL